MSRIEEFLPLIGSSVVLDRQGSRGRADATDAIVTHMDSNQEWEKYDAMANKYLSLSTDSLLEGLERRSDVCIRE
jgi:hypothetical protein